MKFLEIEMDGRTKELKGYKYVSAEEIAEKHPFCVDIVSWVNGARQGSRFSLMTGTRRFIYIRTEEMEEKQIRRIALEA